MRNKRIVFFGTKDWDLTNRHLKYFLENDANIVGIVVDARGAASTTAAKSLNYEDIMETADRLKLPLIANTDVKSEAYYNELKNLNADVFIVCGYQFFLPGKIINLPQLGTLNFHSSLLPRHTGMHPGFWVIWHGDKESGMTVHFMDEGIDTGDIAYQTKVPVLKEDTVQALYDRIWDTSSEIIPGMLDDFEKNSMPSIKQDYDNYFYNYEIVGKDFELDSRVCAEILYDRVKMMPGKFYFINKEKKYEVNDCEVVKEFVRSRKFRVYEPVRIDNDLYFVTPRGFLKIKSISSGGNKIDIEELF